MKIRIVVSGRGYHTVEQIPAELNLADDTTVDDAIEQIVKRLPAENGLPPTCLVAVSGEHLGTLGKHPNRALKEGDELTLIAPVAGG